MRDDEIEARLRRLRPQGPPAELRGRVVAAAAPKTALRGEWLLPLIAAAAAIVLYVLAGNARASAIKTDADPSMDAAVDAFTEQLGGGPVARFVADRIVSAELAQGTRVE